MPAPEISPKLPSHIEASRWLRQRFQTPVLTPASLKERFREKLVQVTSKKSPNGKI